MRYLSETPVNEDEFLRFRISERFNRILRDVYNHHSSSVNREFIDRMAESKSLPTNMKTDLEKIKSGELVVNDFDDALTIVFKETGIDGPDLSEEETMERLHKENIFENLFMKLPRYDLEIISSGDESFIECINEAKRLGL